MTAYIATQSAIDNLNENLADQFTVRLSSDGAEPQTHWGMNWRDIPDEAAQALAVVEDITSGADFWALAESMTLKPVEADE